MDYKILEQLGLTKNESKIYLALLELGTSKTGDILKKADINSGKIYDILEKLKIKGLISESKTNKIRYFTASEPHEIVEYIQKQKNVLLEQEKTIKTILPQLEKIKHSRKKEIKTTTYLGYNGFKTVVKELTDKLKSNDELLSMGITSKKDERYNTFWKIMDEKISKKGIKCRFLFSDKGEYLNATKKVKNIYVRLLTEIIPTTIDIFGKDKVLIMNYTEPSSFILIEDEKIAQSFIKFFEQLWTIAKK